MNKTEYLKELKSELKKFRDELQQEILDDYVQHFAEGEAAGKSDEEIIEELGNIADMIQELGDAGEAAPLSEEGAVPKGPSGEEKEMFVPQRGEEVSGKKFPNISLKTGSANIVLKKSKDEWIHAECFCEDGTSMDDIEFYQYGEGDTFYAEVRQKDGYERKCSFYKTVVTVGKHFFSNGSGVTLVVKVPEGEERLKFVTKSGDVRGDSIGLKILEGAVGSGDVSLDSCACSEVKIMTGSGDFRMNKSVVEIQEVKAGSGDVTIENSTVNRLEISTSSGDVVFEGGVCNEMRVKASSGDVSCSSATIGNISILSSSGDVDLNITAESCEISSSSGDICVTAKQSPRRVKAHTCSGDISLELRNTENANVELRTRGGEIDLRRGAKSIQVNNGCRLVFGTGACEIKAETSGGDISVQL